MATLVFAVDHPELPPLEMPDRFRHEITYFMSVGGEAGIPRLGPGEYWVRRDEAQQWYDDGVIKIVSPLDSENRTEIELSEEQENWLSWMLSQQIQHVRVVSTSS